ncbi:MAG: hypothetical protein IIW14_09145, partial [Kiritimatiellae bacterium]|nr:hypothetical protein [Kiritimatiellia bacterium]
EITYKAKQQNMDAVFTPELAKLLGEYMRNNVKTVYGDGNFPGLTRYCRKYLSKQTLQGMLMAPWFKTMPENRKKLLSAAKEMEEAIKG